MKYLEDKDKLLHLNPWGLFLILLFPPCPLFQIKAVTQTKPLHVYSAVENILEVFHYFEVCAHVSNSKGKTSIPHVLFQVFFCHLNIPSTAKKRFGKTDMHCRVDLTVDLFIYLVPYTWDSPQNVSPLFSINISWFL